MKPKVETERVFLREILPTDEDGLFELDADPEVHRFLGNNPVVKIDQIREVIDFIRQQYLENGIGRWAIIEKSTYNFIGWSGLKLYKEVVNNHSDFYELGYRLIRKYWGQGFATETAIASVNYGFEHLRLNEIFAMTDINNTNSKKVLEKSGFIFVETFDFKGEATDWFKITRNDWINFNKNKLKH